MKHSNPDSVTYTKFLRIPQILELIPIGKSTWWKWVADGKAPKPIKLSSRCTAWKAADILRFIADLEEQGGDA